MKSKSQSGRGLAAACTVFFSVPIAHGAVLESFESGTLTGWQAGTLNGSTTTVDTAFTTDGTFSAGNSFMVPANFSGWSVNTILERDPRGFLDPGPPC